jgi:hypothetical protein
MAERYGRPLFVQYVSITRRLTALSSTIRVIGRGEVRGCGCNVLVMVKSTGADMSGCVGEFVAFVVL